MKQNILIGLSGGPSVAINSSLAGIIKQAGKTESIGKVYGAINGIQGVLNENIIDLAPFSDEYNLDLLKQTPAMALGSCRHKLQPESFEKIKSVLLKYEIGSFFYIGGNDSMDTVLKLDAYFKQNSIEINVIGVPKTIDNDLPVTDHTPGYGSAARYLMQTMKEIICDTKIYPVETVVIAEIMGRNSGWLTLAAALPFFEDDAVAHIIAIPEVAFDEQEFINKINLAHKTKKAVICVVSEGIKDKSNNYIGMGTKSGVVDSFGHTYLSGVGKYLECLVMEKTGCKVRSIELNVMQRCASHLASLTDLQEAEMVGAKAVDAAIDNQSGVTMVFNRISSDPYEIKLDFTDVSNIANKEKKVPRKWFDLESKTTQAEIKEYILPLTKGELSQIKDQDGFPKYITMY